jgi:flagellar biosynthesis chaperone FliJ
MTKGKHSRKTIDKYSSKVQMKKKTVKSHRKHLAEKGEEDNKVSPFTRRATHACI